MQYFQAMRDTASLNSNGQSAAIPILLKSLPRALLKSPFKNKMVVKPPPLAALSTRPLLLIRVPRACKSLDNA